MRASRTNRLKLALVAVLAIDFLAAGCATRAPVRISVSELRDYGDTPLEHTIYLGSDERFHYFAWSSGKSGGEWKVDRSELPFRREFPRGSRGAFLITAPGGTLQPYLGGAQ